MASVMASATQCPNDHRKRLPQRRSQNDYIRRPLPNNSAIYEPLDHISGELYDGHPASSRNMDGANDLHLLLRDPSMHSDLPSRVGHHIAVRHALLKASFDDGDSGDVRNVP